MLSIITAEVKQGFIFRPIPPQVSNTRRVGEVIEPDPHWAARVSHCEGLIYNVNSTRLLKQRALGLHFHGVRLSEALCKNFAIYLTLTVQLFWGIFFWLYCVACLQMSLHTKYCNCWFVGNNLCPRWETYHWTSKNPNSFLPHPTLQALANICISVLFSPLTLILP